MTESEEIKSIYTFVELNENLQNILKPIRYNKGSPYSSKCSCDKISGHLKPATMNISKHGKKTRANQTQTQ